MKKQLHRQPHFNDSKIRPKPEAIELSQTEFEAIAIVEQADIDAAMKQWEDDRSGSSEELLLEAK